MHATLYASESCMKLTLDNGENVNATTAAGSTALLWATAEEGKVCPEEEFRLPAVFRDGFPHGKNQFISAAATPWAVIALSAALESNKV
jgi:hypothetical protein